MYRTLPRTMPLTSPSSLGLNLNSKSGTSPLHRPKEFGPVKCWVAAGEKAVAKRLIDLAVDRDAHAPHANRTLEIRD